MVNSLSKTLSKADRGTLGEESVVSSVLLQEILTDSHQVRLFKYRTDSESTVSGNGACHTTSRGKVAYGMVRMVEVCERHQFRTELNFEYGRIAKARYGKDGRGL